MRPPPAQAQPPNGQPARRGSILDPYRARIDALIAKYPELSAVRVLEEISKGPEGYRGKITLVRPMKLVIRWPHFSVRNAG